MVKDEQTVGSETYGFDAIRGVQASREYYVIICPLRIIPRMFTMDDSDIPAEQRAQRKLNDARIPVLKNYILNNPKEYIFSSLTASVDGKTKFIPAPHVGPDGKLGRLYINLESRFLINDGQHRVRALQNALRDKPELGHESISIVIFEDSDLKQSQQMFSDLNRNAIKPSKSLNILFDHRDEFSQFMVKLIKELEVFNDKVDLEKTSISKNSRYAFTLNGVTDATKKLLGKTKVKKITLEEKEITKKFWEHAAKNIPEWQLLIKGDISPRDLRESYVHCNTNCMNAIGIAGRVIIKAFPNDWIKKLGEFRNVNWNRDNPNWNGRLIQGNRMVRTTMGIEMAANTILQECGIKLDSYRMEFE